MDRFLKPSQGATGFDRGGKEVSLEPLRGCRIKRTRRVQDGVVLAVSCGNEIVYVRVSEITYRGCVEFSSS